MLTKLRFTDANGAFAYLPLTEQDGAVWLGRSARCAVRSVHLTVSSEHCRLYAHGGRWLIENLSRNGTLVNGREIQAATALSSGDEIACGRLRGLEVTFLQEAATAPAPTPPSPPPTDPRQSATLIAPSPPRPLPPISAPPIGQDDLRAARAEAASLREQLATANQELSRRDEALGAAGTERDQALRDQELARSEREELRRKCKEMDALANERRKETIRYQASARELASRLAATETTLTEAMRSLTEERKKTSQLLDAREEWQQRKTAYETKLAEQAHDNERLHARLREALRSSGTASSEVGILLNENGERVSQIEAQRTHIRSLEKQVEQLHAGARSQQAVIEDLRRQLTESQELLVRTQAALERERDVTRARGAADRGVVQ